LHAVSAKINGLYGTCVIKRDHIR